MFLLFPKFHFLARFAMPWSFLCVCRQQAKVLRTNVNTCTIGGSELPFLSVNPYNWPKHLSFIPPLILNAVLLLLPFLSGCLSLLPVLCIGLTQKAFIKIIDMTLSVQHPFITPGCYLLWLEPPITFYWWTPKTSYCNPYCRDRCVNSLLKVTCRDAWERFASLSW